jgi:hypothetical protein
MPKIIRLFIAALGFLSISFSGIARAISINFDSGSNVVGEGSSVTLDVKISGLGAQFAPSLSAYDIGVFFSPDYLSLNVGDVIYGDPVLGNQLDLSGFGSLTDTTSAIQTVDPSDPTKQGVEVRFTEVSLDMESVLNDQQAGDFILARLKFSGVGIGTSPIEFVIHDMADAAGNPIPSGEISVTNGSIQVPEPSIELLLSVGLVSLLRKKRCNL